jgi:hypothetical protein
MLNQYIWKQVALVRRLLEGYLNYQILSEEVKQDFSCFIIRSRI